MGRAEVGAVFRKNVGIFGRGSCGKMCWQKRWASIVVWRVFGHMSDVHGFV